MIRVFNDGFFGLVLGILFYLTLGAGWLSVTFVLIGVFATIVNLRQFVLTWRITGQFWHAIEKEVPLGALRPEFTGRLIDRFGKGRVLLSLVVLIFVPQFAMLAGQNYASAQTTFLKVRGNYHLTTTLGSQGVFVEIVAGKVTGEILLLNLDQAPGLTIERVFYPDGVQGVEKVRDKPTLSQFWSQSVLPLLGLQSGDDQLERNLR